MGLLSTEAPVGSNFELDANNVGKVNVLVVPDPAPPPPPFAISTLAADIVFNQTTGLQRFVVAVPGVTANCWTSLNGEPSTPGEKVGVQGCWQSAADQVTLLADYQSGAPSSSLTVPIRVLWF